MITYMPVLRVKQSEYIALGELGADVAGRIMPLLYQTPAEGDGPEADVTGRRLRLCATHWQGDALYDPSLAVDHDGLDAKTLYEGAMDRGSYAPCTPLVPARAATASTAAAAAGRAAVRITPYDLLGGDVTDRIDQCVSALGLAPSAMTIVYDLGDQVEPRAARLLVTLPFLDDWDRVVMAGGAFAHGEGPQRSEFPRENLSIWAEVDAQVSRSVTFADYGTLEAAYVPAAKFPPAAKFAYTEPGRWFYARERSIMREGNEQMIGIARDIMARSHWRGRDYSWGDRWLADCAAGDINCGNAGTWIKAALTHHITHVVREDVAPVSASPVAA